MVKANGDYSRLASEAVPCGMLLESLLRERGFEVIERTLPESQADLAVLVTATCPKMWTRPQSRSMSASIRNPESECKVQAIVIVRRGGVKVLSAAGRSNTGHTHAISSACNQLADQGQRRRDPVQPVRATVRKAPRGSVVLL